ncbi:MAG: AAA family ATPase [Desulfobulbaceae bacterium]|nr:AAA family ATPase [Desulfobulbaceae bacterium]
MKLRKALEKAKLEREEEIDELVSSPPDRVSAVPGAGPDWQAPVYSESAHVPLDTQLLTANRCVCISSAAPELDYYKVLRTKILQKSKGQGWNTLMVTSARPGEGKTLTSVNLALTLAREFNQTVLLVDCDLKKQDVHCRFGCKTDKGLGDFLLDGSCTVSEIMTWPGVDKMTLISGGQTIEGSTELLGSPRMRTLVAELKERYPDRFVIFDVPSLLEGADALTCAPLVDGILMVVRAGTTPAGDVKKALSMVPRDKLLGCILNGQQR